MASATQQFVVQVQCLKQQQVASVSKTAQPLPNRMIFTDPARHPKRGVTVLREWTPLATQGHDVAQYSVGYLYARGRGVSQDWDVAREWYISAARAEKAFQRGLDLAQFQLGLMYAMGQGVPVDYVRLYTWFNIAASNGNVNAKIMRDKMSAEITPSQIAEAQKLARECVRKKYKDC